MAIRLNALKPKTKSPGLPSSKNGTIRLMRCEDVISMPPTDELGIACLGDFVLEENAEFQFLYLTPQTQKYEINATGEVDERLFQKKASGSYPGSDIEIFEFIKKHINQGWIVVYKEDCEPYAKIFGSPKNPLFLNPNYKSDSTGKGYEVALQQNSSDKVPVLFYNGEFPVIIVDEGIIEIIDIIGQPIEGPYRSRKIYLVDEEPTGSDLNQFTFPLIFRICTEAGSIDVTYDKDGNRYAGQESYVPEDSTLTLGAVTATTSSIHLALHSSGVNSVRIAGQILSKTTGNDWNFPEVTLEKVFTGYAINDPDVFHLALDGEEIPAGALKIFQVIISEYGINIDEFAYGSKMKSDDQWRNAYLSLDEGDYLPLDDERSSINLIIDDAVVTPILYGVMTVRVGTADKNFAWNGKEFIFYTERDVLLSSQESNPVAALPFIEGTNFTAKAETFTRLKLWDNKVCIIASTVDLSPYALDADLDTEIVNRAAADNNLQTQINTEHSTNVAQDAAIADVNIHQITITATTSISTNTLGAIASGGTANLLQHGRNVKISNGVNAINLSCEISSAAAFVASYTKIGSAAITFTAGSGATLVQVDGTAILNGVVGSTACLTRSGNTFYLQISNR